MGRKKQENRLITPLGLALKIYRDKQNCTQEQLADLLEEDPRQIRRWENNETSLKDAYQLKRIADRLGIPYEHLGITASIYTPLSVEQMNQRVDHIWSLIDDARISEARVAAENLLREVSPQLALQEPQYIHAFTRMYHVAAHAASLNARTEEVAHAIFYYEQMEHFARLLKDDTFLNVSLAYHGDMLRRKGDIVHGIEYLEAARDTTPRADASSRGNTMQLLARSYIRRHQVQDFDRAIKNAEDIAYEVIDQSVLARNRSTGNQYNLCHVYEEYAKGYDSLQNWQLSLDYVNKSEKAKPPTKSSEILLKVARAEILIHSGDLQNGEPLAVEAALYSREHGHYRRLERIYALKRYLNQQVLRYGKTELALSEALEGPNEYK
jgi:transcriptional regulator with XRE-family HTH domain